MAARACKIRPCNLPPANDRAPCCELHWTLLPPDLREEIAVATSACRTGDAAAHQALSILWGRARSLLGPGPVPAPPHFPRRST